MLDREWVQLMEQAKSMGLSKQDIQNFLRETEQVQHLSQ
ncbi:DNA-binding anti-repressor SinI [Halobacillus locisalis]|uniref:DNA-binding anti-repressor SinI n=1 Tax=Halobacillus locisalis TaxID=220753 RepID=A0A838CTS9_9BACI|nr:anti-repressor SinI family protein [Halobacillus locisalis]MBA2175477.1 DNA-binding anti-repressor SinI [Halobacillus locisalis]